MINLKLRGTVQYLDAKPTLSIYFPSALSIHMRLLESGLVCLAVLRNLIAFKLPPKSFSHVHPFPNWSTWSSVSTGPLPRRLSSVF